MTSAETGPDRDIIAEAFSRWMIPIFVDGKFRGSGALVKRNEELFIFTTAHLFLRTSEVTLSFLFPLKFKTDHKELDAGRPLLQLDGFQLGHWVEADAAVVPLPVNDPQIHKILISYACDFTDGLLCEPPHQSVLEGMDVYIGGYPESAIETVDQRQMLRPVIHTGRLHPDEYWMDHALSVVPDRFVVTLPEFSRANWLEDGEPPPPPTDGISGGPWVIFNPDFFYGPDKLRIPQIIAFHSCVSTPLDRFEINTFAYGVPSLRTFTIIQNAADRPPTARWDELYPNAERVERAMEGRIILLMRDHQLIGNGLIVNYHGTLFLFTARHVLYDKDNKAIDFDLGLVVPYDGGVRRGFIIANQFLVQCQMDTWDAVIVPIPTEKGSRLYNALVPCAFPIEQVPLLDPEVFDSRDHEYYVCGCAAENVMRTADGFRFDAIAYGTNQIPDEEMASASGSHPDRFPAWLAAYGNRARVTGLPWTPPDPEGMSGCPWVLINHESGRLELMALLSSDEDLYHSSGAVERFVYGVPAARHRTIALCWMLGVRRCYLPRDAPDFEPSDPGRHLWAGCLARRKATASVVWGPYYGVQNE